jgi:3-hydroxybutyryl-CoA dehydrogenase
MDPSITTIGIAGAGTMGQGIAQICAASGFKVWLYDVQEQMTQKGFDRIRTNLQALADKGKLKQELIAVTLSNIRPTGKIADLKGDIIIEAVIEDLAIKQKLFADLEMTNTKESIFLTNTSSIPVTQIGKNLKHPDRFAGLHFFNPPAVMKLVEIVKGSQTSNQTVEIVQAFSMALNKEWVLVQDSPGFIVNRIARLYYVEALKILEEGVTDHETIDKLMRSVGFKMGPFELMDLIGVDTNLSVTKSLYHAFNQEPRFRPSRLQQQKVDAGMTGRKSGKGFYDYKG